MSDAVPAAPDQTSQPRARSLRKRLLLLLTGFVLVYLLVAYIAMPALWDRYAHRHPAFADIPEVTHTGSDIPADPINVTLIGTRDEVMRIMVAARWYPSDPLTLRSCLRIAEASVLRRPYETAPVSSLYLWGRKEDLAFEQPVGSNPRQRHHVRFWRSEKVDEDGRPAWVGAAIYDRRVGLSHTTGQITHHTAADIDTERDYLFGDLQRTGDLSDTYFLNGFHKTLAGHNGGGDPWFTDGRLRVGVIRAAAPEKEAISDAKMPPESGPIGMVWISGGTFLMGCDDFADAQPKRKIHVDGFWMDKTEVTNAQFHSFVEETHYVTAAEKAPNFDEIVKQLPPGVPPPAKENLVPGSLVFSPPKNKVPLDNAAHWWTWVRGAHWRAPRGPGSDLKGKDAHPVVHVAYQDAVAYCAWRSKKEGGVFRLPTEAEWEFAARGGLEQKTYTWGDEPNPQGKWMANTWQGLFPHENTAADGFADTASVASFPANGFGLHDMAGNVWEWCADWYDAGYYRRSPKLNPKGPQVSNDPMEPRVPKRVQRGGSFLCCDEYCKRYVPGARGKGDPDSTTNHIGFRCAWVAK